jgi:O-antigen/teichoic acid export membrane protein
LGPSYLPASNILSILLLGAIISPITMGYIGYVFVIGKYRHATTVGLVAASSRIVLYVLLIPFLGSIGVAVAYISGELFSLLLILSLSRRIGFDMQWKLYTKAIAIPGLIVVLLFFLNIIWLIGIPIVLGISLIAYSRLGVISKSDLLEIANVFFSRKSLAKMARLGSPILKFLFKEEI